MGRFYKVDMRGKYWMQRLPTTPAWQSGDEGRLIYAEDSEEMKFGNSIDWSNAGAYNDVPLNTILLIESDVQLTGYTLLTNKDDMNVYVTKGSGAGGEAAGTDKSGGTWTQPNHDHAGPDHTHTGPSHSHSGPSHVHSVGSHIHATSGMVLSWAQMPAHSHGISDTDCSGGGGDSEAGTGFREISTTSGSSGSHSHGNTGAGVGNTGSGGSGATGGGGTGATGAAGTGDTDGGATVNTWRPRGRNFTRQQRI